MRFQIIHHTRPWRRVDNHLDCRHCPLCGATVHGNRGQAAHHDWHVQLRYELDNTLPPEQDETPEPFTQAEDEQQDEAS